MRARYQPFDTQDYWLDAVTAEDNVLVSLATP